MKITVNIYDICQADPWQCEKSYIKKEDGA